MSIGDFFTAMNAAGFEEFPNVPQQQMNAQFPSWPEVLGVDNDASAQERRARLKHMLEATGGIPLRQLYADGRDLSQHAGTIRIEDEPRRLIGPKEER